MEMQFAFENFQGNFFCQWKFSRSRNCVLFNVSEAVARICSSKQVFLKISQISQENTLLESVFNKVTDLKGLQRYQKETATQMFSCEIYEIFKDTIFYRTPPVAGSGVWHERISRAFIWRTVYLKEPCKRRMLNTV